MTYYVGYQATASDFMSFRGYFDTNVAYQNDSDAHNSVAALLGVGYGSRGYGHTSLSIPPVSTGSLIFADTWNILNDGISILNQHTGLALTLAPNDNIGSLIQSQDGSNGRISLSSIISALDTNRFYASVAEMTLSNVLNSIRTSTWNYASNVYHEFTVNFGTEDAARFFFNSGGAIYISASRVGGTATEMNAAVSQMLNEMGTIIIGAEGVTYTGTNGNLTPYGYFQLTQSFEQIFSHYGDQSSMYSNISYIITARIENYTGTNGGNGSQLRFQCIFRLDDYSSDSYPYGAYAPIVSGTLTNSVANYGSTGVISVVQPTYTTTVSIGP